METPIGFASAAVRELYAEMPAVHFQTEAHVLDRLWNVTLFGWRLVIHLQAMRGTRGPHPHLLLRNLQLQLPVSQCGVYTSRLRGDNLDNSVDGGGVRVEVAGPHVQKQPMPQVQSSTLLAPRLAKPTHIRGRACPQGSAPLECSNKGHRACDLSEGKFGVSIANSSSIAKTQCRYDRLEITFKKPVWHMHATASSKHATATLPSSKGSGQCK